MHIRGRFYIRQSDPAVIAKDRVTPGPVSARPISVSAAVPPSDMAPKSPDFPAGTARLGWCKLWKAWYNSVRWFWRTKRFVIPLSYRNDNKWCILRLSFQSAFTANIQPDLWQHIQVQPYMTTKLLLSLLYLPDCWLEVSIRKVLRRATSTQVFLGFPVSISECWDGSQDSNLPLHASHVAGLLARSQYSEGPTTGHLGTGFSWFPCVYVYKRMLRWFPTLQFATACFSCSPPYLNFLDPYFIFRYCTCIINTATGWHPICS
jgi:hypothetical protein